jgi:hypothetical protein
MAICELDQADGTEAEPVGLDGVTTCRRSNEGARQVMPKTGPRRKCPHGWFEAVPRPVQVVTLIPCHR